MAKGYKTGGRKPGTPNKSTRLLKEAILTAAELAGGGGEEGLVNYLVTLATEQPTAFSSLLGKVLPIQHAGSVGLEHGGKVTVQIVGADE